MNFFELMYYAEAEGLLPTRTGRINAVIEEIHNWSKPYITFEEFNALLEAHGLKYEDLTQRELNYIDTCVTAR